MKILYLSIFTCFLFGTIPAFTLKKPVTKIPEKLKIEDTSDVILFLDTTVLGPFFFPVKGKVISHFGKRGRRMHTGTDIKLKHGDTVRAAFSGIVTKSASYYGYGILVVLKHPQMLETYYAHLSKALVNDGDTILCGMPLGLGGRTGRATTDHLHFEIRKKTKALNSEHFFNFNDCNVVSWVLLDNREYKKEKKAEKRINEEVASAKKKEPSRASVDRKYHTIKKGDTLFSLSRKYGKTVEEICKLNGIKKSGILKVGKKIRVI